MADSHIYFKIIFELLTPLSIGSGNSKNTDNDVIYDSRGVPYIPATSIAGIMKNCLTNDAHKEKIFGCNKNNDSISSSPIKIYDAVQTKESSVSIRNCVKLTKKVAEKGLKFDFEAVETGAEFTGYVELEKKSCVYEEDIIKIFSLINDGLLRFGSKSTRGYGKMRLKSIKRMFFDFSDGYDKWLDFDMFNEKCWENAENITLPKSAVEDTVILLKLKQNGAVSIRNYFTDVAKENETAPNYKYLALRDGKPVIPGTSWCGAFRQRFAEFSDKERTERLFGYVEENDKKYSSTLNPLQENNDKGKCSKSRIVFSESIIESYTSKQITRNSIDRFSAATKAGALYTELTCYNGTTELEILLSNMADKIDRNILSAVISDLDNGYLAIGGLTSIGRGLFTVEKMFVNGIDKTQQLKEKCLDKLIEGSK
jgi:CRISPR/Cas system CSM-associated protein Csm3 (group 7 of RAMP superfamily)